MRSYRPLPASFAHTVTTGGCGLDEGEAGIGMSHCRNAMSARDDRITFRL
jgi:hypothetical protein